MEKAQQKKLIWGIPLLTLFMAGGYLAFAMQDYGDAPLPASVYWSSLLKGLAFTLFSFFVVPVLVKYTLRVLKQAE